VIFPKALGASGAEGPRGFVTAKRQRPSNEIAPKSPTDPAKGQTSKPFAAPAPDSDPFVLAHFGSWAVLQFSDQTQKRGLARCGHWAAIREISLVGDAPSCGCAASRLTPGAEAYAESARRSAFSASAHVVGLKRARQ
jgi:hypothetical protein